MATKEDNRRCACFAKPIGILQFVDTKGKKKNTETEPILRLVLPTGGGPSNKNVNNNACKYYTHVYCSGPSYSKGNCNLIQV